MFQTIRYRLLISNLIVFVLVLSGFAIVVRIVFVQNLRQQLTDRLITLGQSAAANSEIDDGKLKVEDSFLEQELVRQNQTLEWFNHEGQLVQQQGNNPLKSPLNPNATVEIQTQFPHTQAVTLPILGSEDQTLIGYVRVSQRLDDFQETVFQLDIGLGIGVIIAIVLSSAGSVWLNQQAMEPIEASFNRLKQFTADASHELRSPLMAISSNVEVALKYADGMRSEDHEVLIAIASATDQMTQLTEDLLLLARTDQLNSSIPVSVNLSQLLEQLIQIYHIQAEQQGIILESDIESDLVLKGDISGLTRAFTNLIQNALRYTQSGGSVKVEARRSLHQIRVTVTDTGIGIATEHLAHIFERFWRADQARHYNDGGSGLGLSITQAIVQSHKGSIEVVSQLNKGSCFTVKLPSLAS